MGYREFSSVAVIARGEDSATLEPTAPCGICRQLLFEASQISGVDIEVIMSNTNRSKVMVMDISELLPMAFGPKDLGVNLSDYRSRRCSRI